MPHLLMQEPLLTRTHIILMLCWFNLELCEKLCERANGFGCKEAFRTDPSAPEALEALCFAYAKNGEPEALINVADRALNIRPDLTNVSIMQSAAYFNMGWMQEALNILLKALEFEPNSIDLFKTLGWLRSAYLISKAQKRPTKRC